MPEIDIFDPEAVPEHLCVIADETRTPSLSLIAEAMSRKCETCTGEGSVVIGEAIHLTLTCEECGGSGHARVAGVRIRE